MITPFNTGRVLIGCRYTRPMNSIEGDAITVQSALLLCRHTRRSDNLWHFIVNGIWRLL